MKIKFPKSLLPAVLLSSACPAYSGEPPAQGEVVTFPEVRQSRWRVGAAYAPMFGMKAEFDGIGSFQGTGTPQPRGGGRDYEYDNGYVRVDGSGNQGGGTWNWSYEDSSQYNAANGGTIDFSLTSGGAGGSSSERDNAPAGVELFAYYDMGGVSIPGLRENKATWGFRAGFHYAHIDVEDNGSVSSSFTSVKDTFSLNGVVPPPAPYQGSFVGPGPIIGDAPVTRTRVTGQAVSTGFRELDVHLTTMNFGGYLEVPLASRFSLMLEGGMSAAIAAGDYDFQTNTTVPGSGTLNSSGSDSGTSFLPGVYLGLTGAYQINRDWSILASGRYQYMDSFDLEDNGSEGTLSFDSAFVLTVGAMYSF